VSRGIRIQWRPRSSKEFEQRNSLFNDHSICFGGCNYFLYLQAVFSEQKESLTFVTF